MSDDSDSDAGDESHPADIDQASSFGRSDAALPWSSMIDLLNRYPFLCDYRFGDSYSQGEFMRMPDGALVNDPHSTTGYLMGPVGAAQPSEVAAAGQLLAQLASKQPDSSLFVLAGGLGANVGQGGRFDYQRDGNRLQGYIQYREYRDVANFNVGLYAQQAGLSKDETLMIAGTFAHFLSSNARSSEPYSLDPQTRSFIEIGWEKGASLASPNSSRPPTLP